jgi:hypothetical protein
MEMIAMKNFKFLPMFVLVLGIVIGSFSNTAQAATWQNLEIVNTTGKTIDSVYLVISGYEGWGKDLLGDTVIKNGDSKTIRYNADYSRFDFKIVFSDGKAVNWQADNALTLTGKWRLTLFLNTQTKKYRVRYN